MNETEVFFNFEDDRDWDHRLSVTSTPTRSATRTIDENRCSLSSALDETENHDVVAYPFDQEEILKAMDELLSEDSLETLPFRTDTFACPQIPWWRLKKSAKHGAAVSTSSSTHSDEIGALVAPQIPSRRLKQSDNRDTSLIHSPPSNFKLTDKHVFHQKLSAQLDKFVVNTVKTPVVQQSPSNKLTESKNHGKHSHFSASSSKSRRMPVMYQKPPRRPFKSKRRDAGDSMPTDTLKMLFQRNLQQKVLWQPDRTDNHDKAVIVVPPIYYLNPSPLFNKTNAPYGIADEVTPGINIDVEKTCIQSPNPSFQLNKNTLQDDVGTCTHASNLTPDYRWKDDLGNAVEKTSLPERVVERPLVQLQHSSFLPNQSKIHDDVGIRTCAADFTPDYGEDVLWQPDGPLYNNNNECVGADTAWTDFSVDKPSECHRNTSLQTETGKVQDSVVSSTTPSHSANSEEDLSCEPSFLTESYACNDKIAVRTTPVIPLSNSPIVAKKLLLQPDESSNQDACDVIAPSTDTLTETLYQQNVLWQADGTSNHLAAVTTEVPTAFALNEPPVYANQPSYQFNDSNHQFANEAPTHIDYVPRTKYPLRSPTKTNETAKYVTLQYVVSKSGSNSSQVTNDKVPDSKTIGEHLTAAAKPNPNPLLKETRLVPMTILENYSKNKHRIEKWMMVPKGIYMLPIDLQRPPLSYMTLACLAVQNSPTRYVTLPEAYSFVLHHFRYYRYVPDHWKTSIRSCLCRYLFTTKDGDSKKEKSFGHEEEFDWEKICKRGELDYMNSQDTRGNEFFNKMLRGEIGLPRQLFYNAIALQMPVFSGPENSALFYHLLGIKHIPKKFSPLFREHWLYEHSGNEPTFVEAHLHTDCRHSLFIGDNNSFGESLDVGNEPERMTAERIVSFHDNVEAYFKLQKEYKEQGVTTWKTPKLEEVERVVMSGEVKSEYCLPRTVEKLPPGSVYNGSMTPLPPQYERKFSNEGPLPANKKNVSVNTLEPTCFVVGEYRKPKSRAKKRKIEVDPKQKALDAWTTNFSEPYRNPVEHEDPIVAMMLPLDGHERSMSPDQSSSSSDNGWLLPEEEPFGADMMMVPTNQSFDPSSISLFNVS